MSSRFYLVKPGDKGSREPIDPATFPVTVRFRMLTDDEGMPLQDWEATDTDGLGWVCDNGTVFSDERLDQLALMLARAGFKTTPK